MNATFVSLIQYLYRKHPFAGQNDTKVKFLDKFVIITPTRVIVFLHLNCYNTTIKKIP